jgi:hypothetical protein
LKLTKNVLLGHVPSNNMEPTKEYRDRKTHDRRTKETVKPHEREHPVHQPYTRERTNWTRHVFEYDEYDDTQPE